MINKKLIHFKKKEDFLKEYNAGNIREDSIILIKDTREIWTHDTGYQTIPEGGEEGQIPVKLENGTEWQDNTIITNDGNVVTELRIVESDEEPTALITKEEADNSYLPVGNYATLDDIQNVNTKITSEADRALSAEANLQGKYTAEENRAKEAEKALQSNIDNIESLIPTQATEDNLLADKDFVNSSITTNTATFKGTFTSLSELQATLADANDYAVLITQDAVGNTVYNRYKYSDGWEFEFALNNSSFTSDQWKSINSNMTPELTDKLKSLPNASVIENKADKTTLSEFVKKSGSTVTGDLVLTADLGVINGVIFGENKNVNTEQSTDSYLNHAIRLGHSMENHCDFLEYGAVWNFIKHDNTTGDNTLISKIDTNGITANLFISKVPTGTAPLSVTSTTKVDNLNADMVDGLHGENIATFDKDIVISELDKFGVLGYSYNDKNDILIGNCPIIIYGANKNFHQIIAGSISSNTARLNTSVNGVYTGWREFAFTDSTVANANMVDGLHSSDFFRSYSESVTISGNTVLAAKVNICNTQNTTISTYQGFSSGTPEAVVYSKYPITFNNAKKALYMDYITTENGYYVYTLRYLPLLANDYVILVNCNVYE